MKSFYSGCNTAAAAPPAATVPLIIFMKDLGRKMIKDPPECRTLSRTNGPVQAAEIIDQCIKAFSRMSYQCSDLSWSCNMRDGVRAVTTGFSLTGL